MRNKIQDTALILLTTAAGTLMPVYADTTGKTPKYTISNWYQFKTNYSGSWFQLSFGNFLHIAWTVLLVMMAIVIAISVLGMATAANRLGDSLDDDPRRRAEAKRQLLGEIIVFALIGVAPAAFLIIFSLIA